MIHRPGDPEQPPGTSPESPQKPALAAALERAAEERGTSIDQLKNTIPRHEEKNSDRRKLERESIQVSHELERSEEFLAGMRPSGNSEDDRIYRESLERGIARLKKRKHEIESALGPETSSTVPDEVSIAPSVPAEEAVDINTPPAPQETAQEENFFPEKNALKRSRRTLEEIEGDIERERVVIRNAKLRISDQGGGDVTSSIQEITRADRRIEELTAERDTILHPDTQPKSNEHAEEEQLPAAYSPTQESAPASSAESEIIPRAREEIVSVRELVRAMRTTERTDPSSSAPTQPFEQPGARHATLETAAEKSPTETEQEQAPDVLAEPLRRLKRENPSQAERLAKMMRAVDVQWERMKTAARDVHVLEQARAVGSWYQRQPLKWKLLAGVALLGGAFATGGTGLSGAAFVSALFARRAMAGLGTFVVIESLGRAWVEKKEWSEEEKERGRRVATAAGVVAGALLGGAAKTIFDYLDTKTPLTVSTSHELRPSTPSSDEARALYDESQKDIERVLPLPNVEGGEAAQEPASENAEAFESLYEARAGDTLWSILREKISPIHDLDDRAKQSNAIANLLREIKKDPEAYGITSGNVDSLSPGDHVDLEKVRYLLSDAKISANGNSYDIVSRANALSPDEVEHIRANDEKIAGWSREHPGVPITENVAEEIIRGSTEALGDTSEDAEPLADAPEQLSVEEIGHRADETLRADLQTMFGSKGLFGYGFLATSGERSADWLDFKGRPVSEVLSKTFDTPSAAETLHEVGMDSPHRVAKMKEYLNLVIEKSGERPERGETVEQFLSRSLRTIIGNDSPHP